MGAIKPWHLLVCLIVVLLIVGVSAVMINAGRKK
jgi:Sec-independent protein translocase protein TatA